MAGVVIPCLQCLYDYSTKGEAAVHAATVWVVAFSIVGDTLETLESSEVRGPLCGHHLDRFVEVCTSAEMPYEVVDIDQAAGLLS